MRLFILISFWLGVGGFVIRMGEMCFRETWPKTVKTSLGEHMAYTIIGIGVTVWAWYLLFGWGTNW